MDRNLALEFVRVTEAAAIAAAKWVGRGDKNAADQAAVDEMRDRFNQIAFSGRVVIGEGDKDEAPKLFIGEEVGQGGEPEMDLALDPLEATNSVAGGTYNALSVVVAGPKASLLHAPDTYMDKIAVGSQAAQVVSLEHSVADNISQVATALGKTVGEVTVMVLDRPRHEKLIEEIRAAGARVRLITDGDLSAAIATCRPQSGIDLLLGIGGSAEAVQAAAAVKILGGTFLARFQPRSDEDAANIKAHLAKAGITDPNKIFTADELARGNELTFTATGVIEGPLLKGVYYEGGSVVTHSVVMRATSGTIRYITTHHKVRS